MVKRGRRWGRICERCFTSAFKSISLYNYQTVRRHMTRTFVFIWKSEYKIYDRSIIVSNCPTCTSLVLLLNLVRLPNTRWVAATIYQNEFKTNCWHWNVKKTLKNQAYKVSLLLICKIFHIIFNSRTQFCILVYRKSTPPPQLMYCTTSAKEKRHTMKSKL